MKKKEIQEIMGISNEYFEDLDVNPLEVIIAEEWDRNGIHRNKIQKDYQERALERVIDAKIEFTSEFNTLLNLVRRTIKVVNPFNGNEMIENYSGGSGGKYIISFKDEETGDLIQITFRAGDIKVIPKK